MYGLKQAPKSWLDTLRAWIATQGFNASSADPCLYINNNHFTFIFVYVDDLIVIGNSTEFQAKLQSHFSISHKGPLQKILENQLVNTPQGPALLQPKHIEYALEELGLCESKPITTPMTQNVHLSQASNEEHGEFLKLNINFWSSSGFLNFIASQTRPNLSHAVSTLSRFNVKTGLQHWLEAKHAWQYLNHTKNLALRLKLTSFKYNIKCFSDSDGGYDVITPRSHTGFIILFYGCPVLWNSKLQALVSLSSTKGDFKALVSVTQEKLWLDNLLHDLNPHLNLSHCFNIDNKSVNDLINFQSHHSALKHVDTQIKWLQEQRETKP